MAFLPGLAQYSGDPRTEWNLNAYQTKQALLEAVANLPYKGGNTLTGMSHCQDFPQAPIKTTPVVDLSIVQ